MKNKIPMPPNVKALIICNNHETTKKWLEKHLANGNIKAVKHLMKRGRVSIINNSDGKE